MHLCSKVPLLSQIPNLHNYIQQIHADEEVDKIKVFSLGAPQPMFKEAELWEICEGR